LDSGQVSYKFLLVLSQFLPPNGIIEITFDTLNPFIGDLTGSSFEMIQAADSSFLSPLPNTIKIDTNFSAFIQSISVSSQKITIVSSDLIPANSSLELFVSGLPPISGANLSAEGIYTLENVITVQMFTDTLHEIIKDTLPPLKFYSKPLEGILKINAELHFTDIDSSTSDLNIMVQNSNALFEGGKIRITLPDEFVSLNKSPTQISQIYVKSLNFGFSEFGNENFDYSVFEDLTLNKLVIEISIEFEWQSLQSLNSKFVHISL
jgi:hypothetical protein